MAAEGQKAGGAGRSAPVSLQERFFLAQLGERLNRVIVALGEAEAARLADKSVKQLRRYVAGQEPPIGVIARLGEAAGVSMDWLVGEEARSTLDLRLEAEALEARLERLSASTRDGDVTERDWKRYIALTREQLDMARGRLAADSGDLEPLEAESASQPHSGQVPNLLISAGMGNGGLEHIEVDAAGTPLAGFSDGGWSFPAGVARRLGRFAGLYALPVEGDSMEPNYRGGSTVFVDTRRTAPTPPGVFAVDYGDGLLVKRIELIGGTDKVAVLSDNERYRDYEFQRDELTIWGRVVAKFEWVD